MDQRNDVVFDALLADPKGGFKRLLDAGIRPCPICRWDERGEIVEPCDPHLRDYKKVSRRLG